MGNEYWVYYTAKFNGTQKDYFLHLYAINSIIAKDLCRRKVMEETGRHAFNVKAMVTERLPKGYKYAEEGYPPSK